MESLQSTNVIVRESGRSSNHRTSDLSASARNTGCPAFAGHDSPRYFIACGLIGEPVPPLMISGGPQKKNS
jgi:hypothetical protein